MIIKQPTPILRKPRIILLFNGFTATAGCAMVACNGFAATGGTAVVDDAAVAEFVVAVFGVEADVSATGVTAGAGAGMELAEQLLLILAILAEQQLEWGLVVLLVHHKRNRIGHSAVAMYRIFTNHNEKPPMGTLRHFFPTDGAEFRIRGKLLTAFRAGFRNRCCFLWRSFCFRCIFQFCTTGCTE